MKQKLYTTINEFKKSLNESSTYVEIGDRVEAGFEWDDFMQEDTWSEYGDRVLGIVKDIKKSENKNRGYLYKIHFANGQKLVLDENKFSKI